MNVLTFSEARHLVSRTGLGAEWGSIKALEGQTRDKAVEQILHTPPSPLRPPPPLTPWNKLEPMRDESAKGRKDAWMIAQQEGKRLQGWWLEQMLATKSPFIERMTLFWHGFLTSSIQKTLQPSLLYKQNLLLRRHALGNFRHLLQAIARDPAMLVYLDGYQNAKDSPNENFARELLELFTIGRGKYNQADVTAAAKAFTGWTVHPQTGEFQVRADLHDNSPLTFLKKHKGRFTGEQIIDLLLNNDRTAERLAERFWRNFVSTARPNPALIKHWGAQFRKLNYDIKGILRLVLNSPEFWDKRNRGALVKSPVDLLVGTLRMTRGYRRENTGEMINLCRLLGQELFDPPSVKGWSGGEHWISTQTLLVRASYLAKISRGNLDQKYDDQLPLPVRDAQGIIDWMLAVPPVNALPKIPGERRLAHALLLDPSFQVN